MSKYSHYIFLIIVTMMMSVNLFATDVYLPALPEMAAYYKCSQTDIQVSFTLFLIGLAVCQLAAGRLSDYFGRRRVAIVGFSIFTIFSFLCGHATSLDQLNLFRLIQAIGGGVGSVIGRALIVDNYNRQESVKVFSSIYPIVGLSTAIGPPIGGYLTRFWLDPRNASVITDALVNTLIQLDQKHATIYRKNGARLKKRLTELDITLAEKLKNVEDIPFVVFHDAYRYFSNRYGLNIVGVITIHPELTTGAKHLNAIHETIRETGARCLFSEPQFQTKIVKSMTEGFPIKVGQLDPEGSEKNKNPEGYFLLLNDLADSMKNCLEAAP